MKHVALLIGLLLATPALAQTNGVPISQLPPANTILGTELVPGVQNGATVQAPISSWLGPGYSSSVELTNKTIDGNKNTLLNLPASALSGPILCSQMPALTGDTTTTAGACATTTGKIAGTTITNVPASGALVGTSDTQTLTNKSISGTEITSGTVASARLPGELPQFGTTLTTGLGWAYRSAVATYEMVFGPVNVATVAALQANTIPFPTLHLQGYYAAGDGAGGDLEESASCSPNGITTYNDASGHCYTRTARSPASVLWAGAKGDCTTDDTAAFQAAQNAAAGSSGLGTIFVPPTSSCYLVTKINGTSASNVVWAGVGDQSVIKVNGSDADGNWWDLSGSNNVQFRNLKVIDNGSAQRIIFLWACTGTSCGTSGVLSGLSFDHVNVKAKYSLAGLYGYGFGCAANCATNTSGGSLSITNSTWTETFNPVSLNIEETRTAPIDLTAYNAGSVRSVYVTLTTSTAIAARTYIANTDFIDLATTGTTKSNNAAMVLDGVNQFTMSGGSLQCLCDADLIMWTSVEGATFVQTAFQQPAGTACTTLYWVEMGGGVNAAIAFMDPFWSCPSSVFIAMDAGVGASSGGTWYLTVFGNDVGLNTNSAPFIGQTAAGCGSFTAANNWIIGSNINLIAGANAVTTCGSIDAHTIFQNIGTVTVPGGATDSSHHF